MKTYDAPTAAKSSFTDVKRLYRLQIKSDRSSTESKSPHSSRSKYPRTGEARYKLNHNHLLRETRYDMLCFEGIALMLNIFRSKATTPHYRVVPPSSGEVQTITVQEEV